MRLLPVRSGVRGRGRGLCGRSSSYEDSTEPSTRRTRRSHVRHPPFSRGFHADSASFPRAFPSFLARFSHVRRRPGRHRESMRASQGLAGLSTRGASKERRPLIVSGVRAACPPGAFSAASARFSRIVRLGFQAFS